MRLLIFFLQFLDGLNDIRPIFDVVFPFSVMCATTRLSQIFPTNLRPHSRIDNIKASYLFGSSRKDDAYSLVRVMKGTASVVET